MSYPSDDEIDFINELLRDAADEQVAEFYGFVPPDQDERYDPTDEDWPMVDYHTSRMVAEGIGIR